MKPFPIYKRHLIGARERRPLVLMYSLVLIATTFISLAFNAHAIELFEEDEHGNINQQNVGEFKSNIINRMIDSKKERVKRIRALPPFTRIHLKAPVELIYRESGPPRLEIEAPQDAMHSLDIQVAGGVLTIASQGLVSGSPVVLKVFGSKLASVDIGRAADATFHDISVIDFDLRVSGAVDIEINGKASRCSIDARSASDLALSGLICNHVEVLAFGTTDIEFTALESITGRVQGAGNIEVLGHPKERDIKVLGAYSVAYH